MKLILAQGNPDPKYAGTRHNTGFWLIDSYAHSQSAQWLEKTKFHSYLAEATIGGERVLLAKPTTYYNETGRAARALIDFYKLNPESDLLVVHDDIALPLGTVRVRHDGSDAGNNGIKSLNANLGTAYTRLRVGIWNQLSSKTDSASFVLSRFHQDEQAILSDVSDLTRKLMNDFSQQSLEAASYSVLLKPNLDKL